MQESNWCSSTFGNIIEWDELLMAYKIKKTKLNTRMGGDMARSIGFRKRDQRTVIEILVI